MPEFATYPSLRGRHVLITGGATGIGASLVEHFARQGSLVSFFDIADEPAEALAARLGADGLAAPHGADGLTKPRYVHVDLKDIKSLQAAISALPPVDILVNNAAHDQRHKWQDVTPEYWDDRLAVNLRHQFFAAQAVAPAMQASGRGAIVNMGSISWRLGQGGFPAYTTSKAGVEGLTRGLARDLGASGIRVNCIIPGWIMTERQQSLWLTPELEARLMEDQCLKEKLYPPDIARMTLFLAADDSRLCTSQTYVVDGGWSWG